MQTAHDTFIRKLSEHSALDADDIAALRGLTSYSRTLSPNEDFIRQGDKPTVSAIV